MMQIVIKLSDTEYNQLIYGDDGLDYEVLEQAVVNGTTIPDNATNGDVIKAMFPYGKYSEYFADVEMKTEENDTRFKSVFDRDWWDEPYQKGE